ncbi:uncharacterized protein PV09_02219 [Verruconis gallopava]|uniref:SGNH hydrolase-type esterase domain-containing protein n=1 Tax=Verruconis gallopava TaxID=253628 RepID=A0A0D2B815_9PEZI|nr:uncharacterized protein PV09_02219 [Verruconis gallopava]KIW07374.1 hypothetical protein PV09_02219 [Verruconis gallopava]
MAWNSFVLRVMLPIIMVSIARARSLPQLWTEDQIAFEGSARRPSGSLRQPLRYAVFGDSWASGINWGPPSAEVEYNYPDSEEVCRCRRVNEAWPVQLLHDNSSWARKYDLELDYQACYGSWFADVFDQVRRLNQTKTLDLGFLMIGGNPGGFPKIVEDCVFQFDRGKDYGPEYPDPDGSCYRTLQNALQTVRSIEFITGMLSSVYAILNEPHIRRKPNFRLFVVSYADLFNHEDEACSQMTFGIWGGKQPRLTRDLRIAIDAVIDEGRKMYDLYLNHLVLDPRVSFLDANAVLEGHRFCEPTLNGTMEQMNEKSWLYNLEWPQCIPYAQQEQNDVEGPANEFAIPGFCRNCGGFAGLGDFQRPFHPKHQAHEAYKNFLVKTLEKEFA